MKLNGAKNLEAMVNGRLITMSQWDGGRSLQFSQQKAHLNVEITQEGNQGKPIVAESALPSTH